MITLLLLASFFASIELRHNCLSNSSPTRCLMYLYMFSYNLIGKKKISAQDRLELMKCKSKKSLMAIFSIVKYS